MKSQSRHRTERLRISLENEGQRAWPRRWEQQSSELPLRNVHATAPLLGSLPSAAGDTAIESLAFSAYLGTAHGVISDRHCVPAQPLPLPTLLPSLSSHRSRAQDTSTPALSTHAGPGRGGRCACHLRPGVHFQRESVTRGARAQTSVGLQAPLTPHAYLTSHTRIAMSSLHTLKGRCTEERGHFWKSAGSVSERRLGRSGDHRRQDGSCLAHRLV